MPTGSRDVPSRGVVQGHLMAAVTMAFLTGMSFVIGVQKMVQNDRFYIVILALLVLLVAAGILNVRRVLNALP